MNFYSVGGDHTLFPMAYLVLLLPWQLSNVFTQQAEQFRGFSAETGGMQIPHFDLTCDSLVPFLSLR